MIDDLCPVCAAPQPGTPICPDHNPTRTEMNLDVTFIAGMSPNAAFTTTKLPASDIKIEGKPVQSAYAVQDSFNRAVGYVVKASGEWYAVDRDGRCSMYLLKTRAEALTTLRVMWAACMISSDSIAFTGLR